MTGSVYRIERPARQDTAVIFASPHSGRQYGAGFLAQTVLDARMIRSSEDAYIDQIFAAAPQFGAPLLLAEMPRARWMINLPTLAMLAASVLCLWVRRPPAPVRG